MKEFNCGEPMGHLCILLCLTPDVFTRQRGKCLGSPGVKPAAHWSYVLGWLWYRKIRISLAHYPPMQSVLSLIIIRAPICDRRWYTYKNAKVCLISSSKRQAWSRSIARQPLNKLDIKHVKFLAVYFYGQFSSKRSHDTVWTLYFSRMPLYLIQPIPTDNV